MAELLFILCTIIVSLLVLRVVVVFMDEKEKEEAERGKKR